MTEAQLKSFPQFKALPIYDEADPKATTVATAAGSGYGAVRECVTLQQVAECLADRGLVPLGGLRAGVNGGQVVVAYFGTQP
jgi:hypothetical protein